MNVGRRGARVAVTIAGVAGVAVILALALAGGVGWPEDQPARAQFRHCGDGDNIFEWPNAVVTLTPNSGFAGAPFAAEVTGIPTDIETRGIEILWDWDVATPDEVLIGSGSVGPDETSTTVGAVVPDNAEADAYWVAACWLRPISDTWFYKRAVFTVVEPTPTPLYTPTPSPTATLTPAPDFTPTPSPTPSLGRLLNCPRAGKWAIGVWNGAKMDTGEALNECGEDSVDSAYVIDPESQQWLRYLAGRPELSNLEALDAMQGFIAHGRFALPPTPTPTPPGSPWQPPVGSPAPTATPAPGESEMRNCPQAGKWVIAVWASAEDIDTAGALSNCAEEIDFAYELDPESQQWRRWFSGLPEISSFEAVKGGQGFLAHGKAGPPASLGRIAFVSNRDANDLEIYAVNSDGSGLGNLTQSPGGDDSPAWSPDGSKLAFRSYRDGNWEIYVMNADGSAPTRLTTDPAIDQQPVWSPSGAKIAFVSRRSGSQEVWVMNADGSGQTKLTPFQLDATGKLAWSPDGMKIALDSWSDIYIVNSDGTGSTNLTSVGPSLWALEPVWSPDGTKIAYRCCDDDNWEIYVMNADGTGKTNLTNSPGWDSGHAWSPDGAQIAFNSGRDGNDEIYVMKPDGTSLTRLTNTSADQEHDPSWSPDSARLVVECTIGTNVEVCVVDANGVVNVSNHSWVDTSAVWSP